MRIVAKDIEKILMAEGWRKGRGGWWKNGSVVSLNDDTCALFDRFYSNGHREGWERGAYEEMTQEDAEPGHKLDPDGPEIPDLLLDGE
jgi:hypothetical protein